MSQLSSLSLGLLLALVTASAAERKFTVAVESGDFDRRDTVVFFALPVKAGGVGALRRDGKVIPLQVGKDGRASFVLDDLKKGARASYELIAAATPAAPRITATREGTKLKFTSGATARPLLDYQAEPGALPRNSIKPIYARGGYLHPIHTASGRIVTDDFATNHIHQHGVWWAWTRTEFQGRQPDFWNMGDGKGRVEFVALDEHWSGTVHGGFRARHRFVDLTEGRPVTALEETWEVKIFAAQSRTSSSWIFELTSEQRCATTAALKLPEYRYGGLGVRGHEAWNGKTIPNWLTSEGETERLKGQGTRARWCDLWGEIDGAQAGLAILGHPGNFRAPQPMRLHPTEPFFNFAPQAAGDMEIKPDAPHVARYRFVVHDGPPDRAELDRLWNDYAQPPVATVTEAP